MLISPNGPFSPHFCLVPQKLLTVLIPKADEGVSGQISIIIITLKSLKHQIPDSNALLRFLVGLVSHLKDMQPSNWRKSTSCFFGEHSQKIFEVSLHLGLLVKAAWKFPATKNIQKKWWFDG